MTDQNLTLKQHLVNDLNPGFVKALIGKTDSVYAGSSAVVINDASLGDEQAKYVLGYYRRGLMETQFQRTAAEFGIKQKLVQPDGGGPKHVRVSMGHFDLVMCHVLGRDTFPQHSSTREQSAQVNEHIAQLSLLPEYSVPGDGEFYGIIIHSEIPGQKDQFGSIKVGFPNPAFDGWEEEPICLIEVAEMQAAFSEKLVDLQGQIQDDAPKWKSSESNNKIAKRD